MHITYGKEYFEDVGSTPGWNGLDHNPCTLIDFGLLVLRRGESHSFETGDREYAMDILSGTVDIEVDGVKFEHCGGRASVFHGKPTMVYAGSDSRVVLSATTDTEVAVGSAKSNAGKKPFCVLPEECWSGSWGRFNTKRRFNYMIHAEQPSERIAIAEVTVSNGCWATYPPHKHEEGAEGEVFQEEMYFYKVHPKRGFGFCGQFEGKMPEDYAFIITDNTIHKQPFGFHTVTAAPGYSVCYVAVYASHDKSHKPAPHPEHRWYLEDYERTLNMLHRDYFEEEP